MFKLDELQSSDFVPRLHQGFTIRLQGIDPIELELVEVKEAGAPYRPGARQPFSLYFLGPVSTHYFIQHVYHLENDEMGALDLFIVPLGPDEGRMRYEAVLS